MRFRCDWRVSQVWSPVNNHFQLARVFLRSSLRIVFDNSFRLFNVRCVNQREE